MVPRPDIVTIPHSATVTQGLDIALENGYSRIPVVNDDDDDDDVLGVVFAKDLMTAERAGGGERAITELLRPVKFIPENKPVNRLMREMQAEKFHLALVADEYGALSGLITLEDCLEELVGEIIDEHDEEDDDVEALGDGSYLVDGGTSIGDLNELLSVSIPDDDWDTVGGFLFGTLEHLPEEGESIVHEGWRFTAVEMDGRRVRKVKVTLEPESTD
jgi:CBS domain containing-hemolysin-like protein